MSLQRNLSALFLLPALLIVLSACAATSGGDSAASDCSHAMQKLGSHYPYGNKTCTVTRCSKCGIDRHGFSH